MMNENARWALLGLAGVLLGAEFAAVLAADRALPENPIDTGTLDLDRAREYYYSPDIDAFLNSPLLSQELMVANRDGQVVVFEDGDSLDQQMKLQEDEDWCGPIEDRRGGQDLKSPMFVLIPDEKDAAQQDLAIDADFVATGTMQIPPGEPVFLGPPVEVWPRRTDTKDTATLQVQGYLIRELPNGEIEIFGRKQGTNGKMESIFQFGQEVQGVNQGKTELEQPIRFHGQWGESPALFITTDYSCLLAQDPPPAVLERHYGYGWGLHGWYSERFDDYMFMFGFGPVHPGPPYPDYWNTRFTAEGVYPALLTTADEATISLTEELASQYLLTMRANALSTQGGDVNLRAEVPLLWNPSIHTGPLANTPLTVEVTSGSCLDPQAGLGHTCVFLMPDYEIGTGWNIAVPVVPDKGLEDVGVRATMYYPFTMTAGLTLPVRSKVFLPIVVKPEPQPTPTATPRPTGTPVPGASPTPTVPKGHD